LISTTITKNNNTVFALMSL